MLDSFNYIEKNLSIVLQGPLGVHNILEVANNCRHWRNLFPEAEIILSLSTNEAIERRHGISETNRKSPRYTLKDYHKPNTIAENSVYVIDQCCDSIVLAQPAIPLPSIKPTDGPNNSSFMINAAKAGLAAASQKYILRVRSDLIFLNKNFISFYIEKAHLPRRFTPILQQRVMICNLFTVNPFDEERLPYHYSDWFNFGLAEDIRNIWNVPLMTLGDAIFYDVNPHTDNSSEREALFRARIGVEQHVYTSFLRRNGHHPILEHHNDLRGRKDSLMILENDFLIADATYLQLVIKEKADYTEWGWIDHVCIHYKDWNALRSVNPENYISILDRNQPSEPEPEPYSDKANIPDPIHNIKEDEKHPPLEKEDPISFSTKMTQLGTVALPIYKLVLSKKMKKKFENDATKFFEDSNNKIAKTIFKISFKQEASNV